jgi:hypothetical protein
VVCLTGLLAGGYGRCTVFLVHITGHEISHTLCKIAFKIISNLINFCFVWEQKKVGRIFLLGQGRKRSLAFALHGTKTLC